MGSGNSTSLWIVGFLDSGYDDLKSFGFNPDESLLVTGGEDVRLWNFETSELLMKIRPHSDTVRKIAFAENGRAIVSASVDGTIVIWDPEEIRRNLEPYGLAWGSSTAKSRKKVPVLGVEPNVPVDKKEMPANQTPQDAKGEGNDLLEQTELDLPGALRFAQVLRDHIDESLKQRRERFETGLFPSGDAGGQRSLERLFEDAQSRDSRMRAKAIEELGHHHAESDKALPALIIALDDNEVRYKAVASIGKMGTKAKPAIPSLLKSFQSNIRETQDSFEAWGLRRSYQLTLEKIGEAGLPELIQALSHEDEKVRELVASILANMRHRAKPAVPALAKSLSDENKQVRDRIASSTRS